MSTNVPNLPSRIEELCALSGVKEREKLSVLCGLSGCHIRLILSGRQENVRTDVAAKIAATFGCRLDWLITGAGKAPSRRAVVKAVARARARQLATVEPKAAA